MKLFLLYFPSPLFRCLSLSLSVCLSLSVWLCLSASPPLLCACVRACALALARARACVCVCVCVCEFGLRLWTDSAFHRSSEKFKLCMIITIFKFTIFILVSVTLIEFQSHSNIRKKNLKTVLLWWIFVQSPLSFELVLHMWTRL